MLLTSDGFLWGRSSEYEEEHADRNKLNILAFTEERNVSLIFKLQQLSSIIGKNI